jgi:hypothetical protein
MAQRRKTERSFEGDPKGGKRRGLGMQGRMAWQPGLPELTLLPRQDSFGAGEIEEISGLLPAQLRAIAADFPDLGPSGKGDKRRYSRGQVEQLLRVKRLLLEQSLPVEEVQRRLLAAANAPQAAQKQLAAAAPRPLPAALPQAEAEAVHAALPAGAPAAAPAALVEALRVELEAIVALCDEGD